MGIERVSKTSCIRIVDDCTCPKCKSTELVKFGKSANRKQRFRCKSCSKSFILDYENNACDPEIDNRIILYTKEGLGIRSTARILKISTTTLLKRLLQIASRVKQPPIPFGRIYEVDEMRIFIGNKKRLRWIVYGLDRESREIVSFNVGGRTNKTLRRVTYILQLSRASMIYTDRLRIIDP